MIGGSRSLLLAAVLVVAGVSCSGAAPDGETTADDEQGMSNPPAPKSMGDLAALTDEQSVSAVPDDPGPGCRIDAPLPAGVSADAGADALHGQGQERILERDGAGAVAILVEAAKQAPNSGAVHGDLATALLQCKLYSEAVPMAERAVELEPNNVDLLANLAQTYQIVGRPGDAVATYRAAIELDPEDAAVQNNLAVALLVVRDLEGAEKAARAAIRVDPENTNYRVNLGYVLYRQQRLPDAEMVLEAAIDRDPKSADAHNQLGLVLAAQKRNAQARDEFLRALEIDPDHRAARENLQAIDDGFDFTGPWGK